MFKSIRKALSDDYKKSEQRKAVDENLKKTADTLLNELGLNMSSAINIYLKQIVRENGIPFEIKLDKPNAETLQAMQDVREGKNLHGPFNSLSELMEDLNADD